MSHKTTIIIWEVYNVTTCRINYLNEWNKQEWWNLSEEKPTLFMGSQFVPQNIFRGEGGTDANFTSVEKRSPGDKVTIVSGPGPLQWHHIVRPAGPGHTRHWAGHQGPGVRPGVRGGAVTNVDVTDKPVERVTLSDRRPGGGAGGGLVTRRPGHHTSHCPLPSEARRGFNQRLWVWRNITDDKIKRNVRVT